MPQPVKKDAEQIRRFLDRLAREPWLVPQRVDWPRRVYHFTELTNVPSILRNGFLFSRDRLRALGIERQDIADQEIIGRTRYAHKYARLYFRPATPMQHRIEGIRPNSHSGPHCPIPVFLIFDAERMLTRADCWFTDGNLAANRSRIGNSARFLAALEFRDIYHDGGMGLRKEDLKFARCAEVLFEDQVDLDDLLEIVCRSAAERITLLTLLGQDQPAWRDRIRVVAPGERMFCNDWTFITEVKLIDKRVYVYFHSAAGEYSRKLVVRAKEGWTKTFEIAPAKIPGPLYYELPSRPTRIHARYQLAGCLAFDGYLSQRDIF